MSAIKLQSVEDVRTNVGQEIGVSDWRTLDQSTINAFADATGDHQWIHTDPERAATSPFGGTIAHGLLTLSVGPVLMYELLPLDQIEGITFGLNYGYDKIRFLSPVPAGSRIRLRLTLAGVDEVPGGLQLRLTQVYELDGSEKPACIADALARVVLG